MSAAGDLPLCKPQPWHGLAAIERNYRVAEDTFCVRFACEQIAHSVRPGQFVMLKFAYGQVSQGDMQGRVDQLPLGSCQDPLLGRPLAVYKVEPDESGRPHWIEILYLTVGKMTGRLAAMRPGERLELWGPLGRPFFADRSGDANKRIDHLIMVAGGVGQSPFYLLAEEALGIRTAPQGAPKPLRAKHVTLCYGGRSKACLAGVEDFRRLGAEVRLATEDDSAGHHGLVTELVRPAVGSRSGTAQIACCGPQPMMAATAEIARQLGVGCRVSLEERMACGIGICFSCVAKFKDDSGGWTYRRTCLDGPVFDAEKIEL